MYIKSIILDGFKSYGRRTELRDFDPEFTAITGLNGTGKSNILDSICFVLGIMNLGQVRAASFQDLVYKSGQAGITKAAVTLILDNSNSKQCPLGYERCKEISVTRQIQVGGKNKYLINGRTVQNKKVSDFFCSVQLNVNNPSFLIMQGRITKVLNMKPQEILSMIEEAAGTSMYETKREATTKLIEKKDAKVRETNALLQEEVEPRLEKLRNDRKNCIEYQKICREIDYLSRLHISYLYLKKKDGLKSIEANLERLGSRIEECHKNIEENEKLGKEIAETREKVQQEIDKNSGGILKELDGQLKEANLKEATSLGDLKAEQGTLNQEKNKLKSIESNIRDDEKAFQQKKTQLEEVQALFASLKDAFEKDTKDFKEAQQKYDNIGQGLSTNEQGESVSLNQQLMIANEKISKSGLTIKTAEKELDYCRNLLKQKETETVSNDAEYVKNKKLQGELMSETEKLTNKLMSMPYKEGHFENLRMQKTSLEAECRSHMTQLQQRQAYRYELQYQKPDPNFDSSKVYGMVGKLFSVPDPKNHVALMGAAGGSLYSHVTEDDITSKKILERGQLQKRVTIIPLNKISSNPVSQHKIDIAQRLVGKENVQSALSLIQYDRKFDPVMKFVFGHTLICKDLNVAKQVTYNRDIHCRTVTLEGDVVDPEGTLSGGSRPSGGNVLQDISEIKEIERKVKEIKASLQSIHNEILHTEETARTYNKIKDNLNIRKLELTACEERLSKSSVQVNQAAIESLKVQIENLEENLRSSREIRREEEIKVKNIEDKLKDAKGFHEREMKAAKDALSLARSKLEASSKNKEKHEQSFQTLNFEIEDLQKGIGQSIEEKKSIIESISDLESKIATLKENHEGIVQKVNQLKRDIKEQKDKINFHNKELKNLDVQKNEITKNTQELTLEIKKKEAEVNKIRNESKDALQQTRTLEEKYTWIMEDREFFGMKNTRYDYSKEDPVAAGKKLVDIKEKKEKMERQLNMPSMLLLEREEEQYRQTLKRKEIVEQDKEKIQNIISIMDEKKREEVQNAWQVVNENFSSIFSTLLKGSQACLKPQMQNNHLTGLEIKVGFNGVWKESLGELSGGQRSLVALSLVLAMLKFSPAPIYILDEVDAALDMSHTQNIGNMLKTHFRSSQFIIVSLKDGMFNNANVLYRTKFDEGVSMVERLANANTR